VFVSNLNYSLSEVHLRDVLSAAGDIREVRLALNNAGTSRGFGYVEFKSEASSLAI
jgi:RNA recognition motif-containing protein